MRVEPRVPKWGAARKVLAATFAVALTLSIVPQIPAQTARPDRSAQSRRGSTNRGEVRTRSQSTESQATGIDRSHIPPIIIRDGSLTVRADRFNPKMASGNPNRPHRYKRNNFNDMRRVVVTAFTEEGIPYYYPWDTPGGGWRVRIFLERWNSGLNAYVPVHRTEPQIEVKDNHEIEIDVDMLDSGENEDCQPVPGSMLECKFEHPGFGGAHFRIRDVRIHRGDSPKYEYPAWPANKHEVHIKFYYHHPHP